MVISDVPAPSQAPDNHQRGTWCYLETARALDVSLSALGHVGDDAPTDGGADRVGATAVLLEDMSLTTIADRLREGTLC